MKSYSEVISNSFMSGVAITTLGLPPSLGRLASISPKVRVTWKKSLILTFELIQIQNITESLPGKTR
jgi:hypothetical protein